MSVGEVSPLHCSSLERRQSSPVLNHIGGHLHKKTYRNSKQCPWFSCVGLADCTHEVAELATGSENYQLDCSSQSVRGNVRTALLVGPGEETASATPKRACAQRELSIDQMGLIIDVGALGAIEVARFIVASCKLQTVVANMLWVSFNAKTTRIPEWALAVTTLARPALPDAGKAKLVKVAQAGKGELRRMRTLAILFAAKLSAFSLAVRLAPTIPTYR